MLKRWTVMVAVGVTSLAGCQGADGPKSASGAPQAGVPARAPEPATSEASAGLGAAELAEYYHLPEGGELLPLDVLRALESVKTFKPFMTDLERFRLIPDPADPDGLPVGMSAAMLDGKRTEPRAVFFNCAACHTAELSYQGKTIRVEGAPAQFDMAGFIVELLASVDATIVDPKRLSGFVGRLVEQGGQRGVLPADLADARLRLDTATNSLRLIQSKLGYLQGLRGLRQTTVAGFGRLDAFMAARNLLFGDATAVDVNSPVSLPPIFGLARLSWYHYDNSTTSILQRNIGEDLGVGAVADMKTGESTVEIRSLMRLEALAAKIQAPRWPTALLGELDAARIGRGAPIYQKECAGCHEPDADGTFPDRVYDLATIGTDPNRAVNFARPLGDRPFVDALAGVLALVQAKALEREGVKPEEVARLERGPVVWRATGKYAARPLAGVWATAPYLHNGSVPTLHDLLLPPAQRPGTFLTGSREIDPGKVGLVADGSHGGVFLLDTAADGNHNTGHVYATTLAEEDRLDLLEYLKSL